MSITSDLIRGHTDTIILSILLRGDNYGYKINRIICDSTEGKYELKEATLYTSFKRLEEQGCITSYWGDEAMGARRKYYSITALGRTSYSKQLSEWYETRNLIDNLLEYNDANTNERISI